MVEVSHYLFGGEAHISNKALEGEESLILEALDGINKFITSSPINDEKIIFNSICTS